MKTILLNLIVLFLTAVTDAQVSSTLPTDCHRANGDSQSHSTYLLGPGDELELSAPELDEVANKPTRVDGDGNIQVPLIGRVHISGLTVQQSEQELNKRLSTYIREPQVAINVKELRSQPVSVLGAVNTPGVHQLQGHKTLLEVLSLAGGIRQDAGYSVRVTRRLDWGCVPVPHAILDASGRFSVGEVNLKKILGGESPAENIEIFPDDVVSVPKAEMVYVIGEVKRSGGFVLGEHESLSIIQVLSLAEGLERTADARHAKILRRSGDAGQREERAVDVRSILTGERADVALNGDDILFIPGSTGKKAALRALEAAVQTGTGLVIWRR